MRGKDSVPHKEEHMYMMSIYTVNGTFVESRKYIVV